MELKAGLTINQHIGHLKAMRVKIDIIEKKQADLAAKLDKLERNTKAYAAEIMAAAKAGKKSFKRQTDFR